MRSLLTTLLAFVLSTATASATSVQFTQGGWFTGATLDVAFAGQDTNADGALSQSELSAFTASWLTPLGDGTTWNLEDIQPEGFFFIDLGNYLLFTSNENFSLVSTAFEGEALASIFDSFLFPVDDTATPPTAAPEPFGLTAAGFGVLQLSRWLSNRKKSK